jgi:hypothetical protein
MAGIGDTTDRYMKNTHDIHPSLESMTKEERSLLLFFEDCAVNKSGRVNSTHMNDADREIAQKWNLSGFVEWGRIASEHLSSLGNNWCLLSEQAWEIASAERKARAGRLWSKRSWATTKEKKES